MFLHNIISSNQIQHSQKDITYSPFYKTNQTLIFVQRLCNKYLLGVRYLLGVWATKNQENLTSMYSCLKGALVAYQKFLNPCSNPAGGSRAVRSCRPCCTQLLLLTVHLRSSLCVINWGNIQRSGLPSQPFCFPLQIPLYLNCPRHIVAFSSEIDSTCKFIPFFITLLQ